MKVIEDVTIPHNTGKAFTVKKGQHIRVYAESTSDFVAFNLHNLKERFDQARTKVDQGKIFISKGDRLISKSSNTLLTIVEDTYEGKHDLQKGMCNAHTFGPDVYKGVYDLSKMGIKKDRWPDHGCWENLTEALKPWNIAAEDIPAPFNLVQWMTIDGETGRFDFKSVFAKPGTYVEFRAEIDVLVAVSACPSFGYGKPVKVQISQP